MTMEQLRALALGLSGVVLLGCSATGEGEPGSGVGAGAGAGASVGAGAGAGASAGAGAGAGAGGASAQPPTTDPATSGMPCEVAALLGKYCTGCHSSPPARSVPMPLVSYDDLTKPSRRDPARPTASLCVERLQLGTMPPPPSTRPSAAEIAAFESWVNAGMPRSGCGAPIDAGPPAPDPYDTPLQCSSGTHWTRGDHESPEMHPGRACITCHSREGEAPRFSIGGTVFPTAHEPDDCNGSNGSAGAPRVVITDARGAVLELAVNSAGNFFHEGTIALPFSAKVVAGGKERAMSKKQTTGDCNSCHTVDGANDAPGRIMAP
jgi:hypothetical protein